MNENGSRSKTHLELLNSPQGSGGKAASAYSGSFASVLQLFPSKSAFCFKAKLQKLEVVLSNSSAPLLLGLISFVFCYLLSSCQLEGSKGIVSFSFPHLDTPLPKPQKAAWI